MRRYGTAYFANIRIRIIRALFHKNIKKLCNISDKAASLQTQTQNFRSDIGYFKEICLLRKHGSSFVFWVPEGFFSLRSCDCKRRSRDRSFATKETASYLTHIHLQQRIGRSLHVVRSRHNNRHNNTQLIDQSDRAH